MMSDKKETAKRYRVKAKKEAYLKIDYKLKCNRCGCNDLKLLEINHINGGGRQEYKNSTHHGNVHFHRLIVTGRRKINDLELLCRPCNSIHYLELKFKRPLPMQVVWTGDES